MAEEKHHEDDSKDESYAAKGGIRVRLMQFTWPWFACTMSTGAVAVVLAQTPNRFKGLDTIGNIFFILDLVLFVGFTCAIATRFSLASHTLFASLHHPIESLFFGSFWVSIALILACTQLYGVAMCGSWLVKTLEVLFWLYGGLVLLVAILQYHVLFQKERLNVRDAMPAWIFPSYPLLVTGTLAADMLTTQPMDSAITMWHGAVLFQGLGWIVAFLMYSMYMQRLMTGELPSPPTRPGMYVSVGPAGYTSAGIVALSTRASSVLPDDWLGLQGVATGQVIRAAGTVAGIFVFLFAFWFFAVTTVAVLAGFRRMTFTLNWWAFIFPNAGLTLAAMQIADALKSNPIRGVTSAMTLLLVIMWIIVAIANIRAVWRRDVLWPGKDDGPESRGVRWGRHVAK